MRKEVDNLKENIFSVYDHILNQKEAGRAIMSYSQAVKEDRLDIFEIYQEIYINSFRQLYNCFEKDILIYTIYEVSKFPISIHFEEIKSFSDGVETLYKCDDVDDFLNIVTENLKEYLPFRDVVFRNRDIGVRFNFEFTFLIVFKEAENSFVEELRNIFIANGFHLIA